MPKSFRTLKNKMSPKAKQAAMILANKMLAAMPLQELRQAKQLSQNHLAQVLETKQANISRLERRTDMYISTLRSYIEAMGGNLEIIAKFPEGDIYINQFKDIEDARA
jgi:transcriptional regulator with XRE-family HTH domain